jgi:hypothetical protein
VWGLDAPTIAGYWDEGSRDDAWRLNLKTMMVTRLGVIRNPHQFGGGYTEHKLSDMDGDAIVVAGTSCGKPAFPTIYMPGVKESD